MIAKSAKIAFFCSINKHALGEGHKIEVLNALVIVLYRPAPEYGFVDDLSKVFENEVASMQVGIDAKAIAFLLCLDDRYVGVRFALESLILTRIATVTIAIHTLHFCQPIHAVRVFSARVVFPIT